MDSLNSLKIVTGQEIERVLDYDSLIDGLAEAFSKFSLSTSEKDAGIHQPSRVWVSVPEHNGQFGSMPVGSSYNDVLATKLITFYPNNTDAPTHHALILTFNRKNGVPKAILDGELITALRTAAASAVATKLLVNGKPKVLAILGAGVQGKSHFQVLSHLYQFQQVKVWSRTKSKADKLVDEIGSIGQAFAGVEETVKDADIIVTATSASSPVLMADWVKPGAHINGVGACQPNISEIDPVLMNSAVVYADSRSAVMNDSGDQILSGASIYAEIGEVINGEKEARSAETTIFNSVGMAIQDGVAAKIVLDKLGNS